MNHEVPNSEKPAPPTRRRSRRGLWLAALVLGMLAFAFINVPLFRVFCEHYGLYVAPDQKISAAASTAPAGPEIHVVFTGISAKGLDVTLTPSDSVQDIHVGQRTENKFTFTNNSDQTVRFRAIHDIFPADAATHTALIQCFCFSDQTMKPHATKTLPVIYELNPGMNPQTQRVSLMYTLEPLAPAAPAAAGGQ